MSAHLIRSVGARVGGHVAACSVNVTLKVHTCSGPSVPATGDGAVKVCKMCDCVSAVCIQHAHLPPVCRSCASSTHTL